MQTLSQIRALLEARGLRPRHRFGQNFLHDERLVRRLIEASGVQPGDLVLEIGPGTGVLTEMLLEAGATVIAAEIDRDLSELLAERLGDRITLVRGDCMGAGRSLAEPVRDALAGRPYRLVANLPYNVASPIMSALLLHDAQCLGQHVTIQREVADRLIAAPGGRTYGTLSVLVQLFASVKRIANLPAGAFWPPPKVESAMISIVPLSEQDLPADAPRDDDAREAFARFVSGLFGQRRKQLGRILGRDRTWPEGIDPVQRPEVLAPAQIAALWRTIEP